MFSFFELLVQILPSNSHVRMWENIFVKMMVNILVCPWQARSAKKKGICGPQISNSGIFTDYEQDRC